MCRTFISDQNIWWTLLAVVASLATWFLPCLIYSFCNKFLLSLITFKNPVAAGNLQCQFYIRKFCACSPENFFDSKPGRMSWWSLLRSWGIFCRVFFFSFFFPSWLLCWLVVGVVFTGTRFRGNDCVHFPSAWFHVSQPNHRSSHSDLPRPTGMCIPSF